GTKHNAIANVAKATIVHTDYAKVKDAMNELFTHIKKDYHVEDPNMSLEFKEVKAEKVMTKKDTNRIINFLMLAPHGVIYMSKDIEDLVMTSCNAAVLRTEGNGVNYLCSIRSSSDAALVEVREQVRIMTEVLGGKVELSEAYPSWEFDEDPVLRDLVSKVYKEVTGEDAEVSAIHAGLECGLLKQILPDTKMISFGPNIYDVHTNREHLDIKSTARMWEFLKALLKAVK
ncbi:MAG: M20/M25/M40 family metallo-hydrolase, partial [Fenollaria timonensis]